MKKTCSDIIEELKSLANPEAVKGMVQFGINPENTYGVSIPSIRNMAKEAGKDHALAQQLWESGIHEARILACLIDRPEMVTEGQMESSEHMSGRCTTRRQARLPIATF